MTHTKVNKYNTIEDVVSDNSTRFCFEKGEDSDPKSNRG